MRYIRALATVSIVAALAASSVSGPFHRHHQARVAAGISASDDSGRLAPTVESMAGTWVVCNHEGAYRDVRAVLRRDGTFRFRGSGWSSSGRFHIRGQSLCLEWCEIDGEAVDEGTVRKAYDIDDDCGSFTIDNYRYRRLDDSR